MTVLVTGGTGYIGSHLVRLLRERGRSVLVVDDLITGFASRIGDTPLLRLDLASDAALDTLAQGMLDHGVTSVVHFAARKQVGESVSRPAWYFRENLGGLATLLMAMEKAGVSELVFSSSAAVYAPADHPLTEIDATAPVSPYGETKLVGEWLVKDATIAWGLRAVSLRYFNVAGAGAHDLGDTAALNLVPMVFERLDAGVAPRIFGDDYGTPDGTCIRDYVHVQDIAEAHLAAIAGLTTLTNAFEVFNVGTGRGLSVRQIIDAILRVSEASLAPEVVDRRPGDPATVVASVEKIRAELGWSARFELEDIIQSAWDAHVYLQH